jgi:hypothetical protein
MLYGSGPRIETADTSRRFRRWKIASGTARGRLTRNEVLRIRLSSVIVSGFGFSGESDSSARDQGKSRNERGELLPE